MRKIPVFLLPAPDRILQAGEPRDVRCLSPLILDQPFHDRPVAAHLAEQVVKQDSFLHGAGEQFLRDMRFPTELPQQGCDRQREPVLRANAGMFLGLRIDRVEQIYAAVGALGQPNINIRAAITAFDLVVFRWGCEAGGHVE